MGKIKESDMIEEVIPVTDEKLKKKLEESIKKIILDKKLKEK